MPLGKVHQVLCVACSMAVTTLYAYDERRCGYTTTGRQQADGILIHVSCTNPEGSRDCGKGSHYDKYVCIRFTEQGRLRATRDGQTGRP